MEEGIFITLCLVVILLVYVCIKLFKANEDLDKQIILLKGDFYGRNGKV